MIRDSWLFVLVEGIEDKTLFARVHSSSGKVAFATELSNLMAWLGGLEYIDSKGCIPSTLQAHSQSIACCIFVALISLSTILS